MEDNLKLYGELSQMLEVKSNKKLYNIIKKYHINSLTEDIDFKECVGKYIFSRRAEGVKESTLSHYQTNIEKFGLMFNFKPINQFKKEDIQSALNKALEHQQKQTTYVFWNINKNFFDWMENENIITKNPFKGVNFKHKKSQRHYILEDDITKIQNACETLLEKTIIEFLLSTGCRISEIPKITFKDINFKYNQCIVTGKGDKTRTILFSNKAKKLIKENIKQCTDNEHVFCINKNEKIRCISGGEISKIVKDTSKRANIPYSVCPHMYRHTFATRCLAKGMDITSIQKLLGHSDISTTQVYAETNLDSIKKEYNKVFKKWIQVLNFIHNFYLHLSLKKDSQMKMFIIA